MFKTVVEKRADEGRLERLARLGVVKNLGGLALGTAGAVLLPPVGAAMAVSFAAAEGVGVLVSKTAHDHLKNKRLRKVAA